MSYLYFLVETGSTLELVRKHIADRQDAERRNKALLDELGVDRYFPSILDGTVVSVEFGLKPVHPDFKMPDRKGRSWPKKGTEWARRFNEQVGYDRRGYEVAKALGVPSDISFTGGGSHGSSCISRSIGSGTGFLYLSPEGPYALYVPDVAAKVAEYEAQGFVVDDDCKNFKPEFPGCRPILKEEWDFIVAKHDMDEAKAARAAA